MDGVRKDLQQIQVWQNLQIRAEDRSDWRVLVVLLHGPLGLVA